jgi:hypothetical protein
MDIKHINVNEKIRLNGAEGAKITGLEICPLLIAVERS